MSATEPTPELFRRRLITPEGVDLRIGLGSASQRAGAFLLDFAIIMAVMIGLSIACLIVARYSRGLSQGAVQVLWLIGFFALRNGWFLAFELGPRAATPGKRVFGLRVTARNGGRLTADALFARNAMREIEVFLPLTFLLANANGIDAVLVALGVVWSGVFALFPLFNRDRLRAGDLVAGTWVIRQPKRRLSSELTAQTRTDPRFAFEPHHVQAYGAAELQVLEGVLRNGERRAVRLVADRIRRKIGWVQGAEETDLAFLSAYYAALRARLEAGLLLGRRRRDKHDVG